jgi:hypothetical protein
MVGVDKKKIGDIFKKADSTEQPKTTARPAGTSGMSTPKAPTGKATAGSGGMSDSLSKAGAEAKVDAFINKREALSEAELKKQKELLHTKTHQDLINAVYKVADELKVEGGPWPMLRAAGWGHFTDDRGKKYDGPAIDEIEGFEFAQKVALKKILGVD